jgi:alkylhydroperoxidase family enzyme
VCPGVETQAVALCEIPGESKGNERIVVDEPETRHEVGVRDEKRRKDSQRAEKSAAGRVGAVGYAVRGWRQDPLCLSGHGSPGARSPPLLTASGVEVNLAEPVTIPSPAGGTMARLPYVDPATAPESVRETLAELPADLNIFKLMAHAETNFRPLLRLGTSILAEQKLDARLRELAILRVAKLSGAEYEWVQHVPIAQVVGASDDEVAALDRGEIESDCFDPLAKLVLRFTDEVVRDVGASEQTFNAIAEHLGHREIVELILAIGFYMTVARLMETTAIDIEPGQGATVLEQAKARGLTDPFK